MAKLRFRILIIILVSILVYCNESKAEEPINQNVIFNQLKQSTVELTSITTLAGGTVIEGGVAFCIDTNGYYLTCAHIICDPNSWTIRPGLVAWYLNDKTSKIMFPITVISVDSANDIGIIKIIDIQTTKIQSLSIDTSENYDIGDEVYFCGCYTKSLGIYFCKSIINSYMSYLATDIRQPSIIQRYTLYAQGGVGLSGSPVVLGKNHKVIGIINKYNDDLVSFPMVIPMKYAIHDLKKFMH